MKRALLSLFLLFVLLIGGGVYAQESMNMSVYSVSIDVQPAEVVAGQPFRLTLNIFGPHSKTLVTNFDEVHTKLLHLIIVSEDLTVFMHVHPELGADGRFTLDSVTLPRPGNYVLFADFTPTGDQQQVIRLTLSTKDAQSSPANLELSPRESTVGPLKIALDVPDTLSAGAESMITFHVSDAKTGDPVNTLDAYLGAAGHLVIIDSTTEVYLHTHPVDDMDNMGSMGGKMGGSAPGMHTQATAEVQTYGPDMTFHTEFPAPGRYAMWLQVQYQGEVYTAPFVVDVTGEATPEATMQM
jgi:hypothetical protein